MKLYTKLIGIFCLLLLCTASYAQSTFEDYIKEGIALHDKGELEASINSFKKALELQPNSDLANYEMALSYFKLGNHPETI